MKVVYHTILEQIETVIDEAERKGWPIKHIELTESEYHEFKCLLGTLAWGSVLVQYEKYPTTYVYRGVNITQEG